MLRTSSFVLALGLATATVGGGCHHDPQPMTPKDGELPPLPPASGTPVGYLLDNSGQLALRDDQIARLKQIDGSLAARNDGLETQLREIEKPEEEEPPAKNAPPPKPRNNAPGAGPIHTTPDAAKLHAAVAANNKDALEKAFAILDPSQQAAARKLLDARGVAAPGGAGPGKGQPPPKTEGDGGVPLEP